MPKKKKDVAELDLNIYTKSGKLRKRKPKQSRNYFNQETQDAIILYVNTEDETLRNKIYNDKIAYSFYKLAENIINTFKFPYTEVDNIEYLKHEVITFILPKLPLFDKDRGKAYSYFGTAIKRYLITYNKKNYEKYKAQTNIEEVDTNKTIINDLIIQENKVELAEFFNKLTSYIEKNIKTFFPREIDRRTANAILELFNKREDLDLVALSKQSFYFHIKEVTGNTAPQVTKVVKEFKNIYRKLMNEYYLTGDIYI